MFALLRLSQACEAFRGPGQGEKYLADAENLIKAIHPYFVQLPDEEGQQQQQQQQQQRGGRERVRVRNGRRVGGGGRGGGREGGVYWKMGYDLSVIGGVEVEGPSEDCLSGWVVYSLVKQEGERVRREQQQQQQQQQQEKQQEESSLSPIAAEQADLEALALSYLQQERGVHVTSDPLGWGLIGWRTEKMGEWAEPIRARLRVLAPKALAVERGMMLPFRLYGAILGGRLLDGREGGREGGRGEGREVEGMAEGVLEVVVPVELGEREGDLTGINKVMLAAALDPVAFARLEGEEVLGVPGAGK